MSYMKSLLVAAAVVLFSMELQAAEIDAGAAQAVAQRFVQSRSAGKLMVGGEVSLTLAHAEPSSSRDGAMDYYVFNTSEGSAFVIVAGADDRQTVLGYGEGSLDMGDMPDGLRWLLGQYKAQMEALYASGGVSNAPRRAPAPVESAPIEPMLACQWSQGAPYYDQCPAYQGGHSVTGCTATAMAQVMYYWKYPAELPPVQSYTTSSLGLHVPALPGTILDWDNMLDTYRTGQYSPVQGDAVATLMRYCGQSCYMDYTPDASGASQQDQLAALKTFGYNPDATFLERDDFTKGEWDALLLEDLSAGRPVAYVGYTETSGHSFVLDGFSDGYYHVNWGWGGSGDGYFTLDLLGYGISYFSYSQSMAHAVYPDAQGSAAVCYDFECDGIYYKENGGQAIVMPRDNGYNSYSGAVSIPSTVSHDGRTLTVTAIGDMAFARCGNLTRVDIPSTVKTIGKYAFTHCESLAEVKIGSGVERIGSRAFTECWGLDYVDVEDVAAYSRIEFEDYWAIPMVNEAKLRIGGQDVTDLFIPGEAGRVSDMAFIFCDGLKSVTIGEGVTSVGDYAFYCCPRLERVELPSTLTSIDYAAFCECCEMEEIVLKQGLRAIDKYAFNNCLKLRSVTLPSTMSTVGFAAFAYCDGLQEVTFDGCDVTLVEYAFHHCPSLASVNFSDNQTVIGPYAFSNCSALTQAVLPPHLKEIGPYAFTGCSSLRQVVVPASLQEVGESAFSQCSSLSRVDVPSVKDWCRISFKNATSSPLTSANHLYVDGGEVRQLVIPEGITAINDYAFYGCEGLEKVVIGDEVSMVGNEAFYGCKGLAEVSLGDGVLTVGSKAFSSCDSLAVLSLGQAVQTIGPKAFSSCYALLDITSQAMVPPALDSKSCFAYILFSKSTLHVPAAAIGDYGTANVWSLFKNVVPIVERPAADVNGDGEVTLADVNAAIAEIYRDTPSAAADVNGDGEVNIADVNAVIDEMLVR